MDSSEGLSQRPTSGHIHMIVCPGDRGSVAGYKLIHITLSGWCGVAGSYSNTGTQLNWFIEATHFYVDYDLQYEQLQFNVFAVRM